MAGRRTSETPAVEGGARSAVLECAVVAVVAVVAVAVVVAAVSEDAVVAVAAVLPSVRNWFSSCSSHSSRTAVSG